MIPFHTQVLFQFILLTSKNNDNDTPNCMAQL
jgi:hypothetical protein